MSDATIIFHYRVRAFVYIEGKVLLARMKVANYTYLPGGHIELGENAASALARELQEELGEQSEIKNFLGAIENSWVQEGERHHEINLIFNTYLPSLSPSSNPASKEDHLEFMWAGTGRLGGVATLSKEFL